MTRPGRQESRRISRLQGRGSRSARQNSLVTHESGRKPRGPPAAFSLLRLPPRRGLSLLPRHLRRGVLHCVRLRQACNPGHASRRQTTPALLLPEPGRDRTNPIGPIPERSLTKARYHIVYRRRELRNRRQKLRGFVREFLSAGRQVGLRERERVACGARERAVLSLIRFDRRALSNRERARADQELGIG